MQRLSDSQKRSLREAAIHYHRSFPDSPADDYMASRGLGFPSIKEKMDTFMLGFVADPLPGDEMFQGMLAIPYLRWSREHGWAVVSIRYRRLDDGKPKYLTRAGDRPRLYNTLALLEQSPSITITEGEIDAMTAQVCGIPTVGVPGAQAWKPHFREPFVGYKVVYILADGDEAGLDFANGIAKSLPRAKVISCPPGQDVNSLVLRGGPAALLERIKK